MRSTHVKVISVIQNGVVYLIPSKEIKLKGDLKKMPGCRWCDSTNTSCILEYAQYGFLADKHTIVLYCNDCLNATVVEYHVEIGSEL